MSENKRHSQPNVAINDKSQGRCSYTFLSCIEIFYSYIFINLLLRLPVKKKLFKSVNTWQNCRQEGGYRGAISLGIESAPLSEDEDEDEHVYDHEQKQFPVTLMTHIRMI